MFSGSRTSPASRAHPVREWLSRAVHGFLSLTTRSSRRGAEVGFVRASDPNFHFHSVADASTLLHGCVHEIRSRAKDVSRTTRARESASTLRASGATSKVRNAQRSLRSTLEAASLICSLGKPDAETTAAALAALAQLEGNADLASLTPSFDRLRTLLNGELPPKPFHFAVPRAAHSSRLFASLTAASISHAHESLARGSLEDTEDFLRIALRYASPELELHRGAIQKMLGELRERVPATSELLAVIKLLENRLGLF